MNWALLGTLLAGGGGAVMASFGALVGCRLALARMGDASQEATSWRSLLLHPSRCDSCAERLGFHAIQPLVGFLFPCGSCGARSRWLWPALEWSTALGTAGCFLWGGAQAALGAGALAWLSSALAAGDATDLLVPEEISVPGTWIAVLVSPAEGAALGAASLFLLGWTASFVARRDLDGGSSWGGGDSWLLAVLGAWAGFPGALAVVVFLCLAVIFLASFRLRAWVALGLPVGIVAPLGGAWSLAPWGGGAFSDLLGF